MTIVLYSSEVNLVPRLSLRFLPCRRGSSGDEKGGNGERAWVRGCSEVGSISVGKLIKRFVSSLVDMTLCVV